jgi:hypothetical protein
MAGVCGIPVVGCDIVTGLLAKGLCAIHGCGASVFEEQVGPLEACVAGAGVAILLTLGHPVFGAVNVPTAVKGCTSGVIFEVAAEEF